MCNGPTSTTSNADAARTTPDSHPNAHRAPLDALPDSTVSPPISGESDPTRTRNYPINLADSTHTIEFVNPDAKRQIHVIRRNVPLPRLPRSCQVVGRILIPGTSRRSPFVQPVAVLVCSTGLDLWPSGSQGPRFRPARPLAAWAWPNAHSADLYRSPRPGQCSIAAIRDDSSRT